MPLKIVVVGSGIAGLAVAAALSIQGHQVSIYERRGASNFEETGSGIQLQTNICHILEEWGILDTISRAALDNVGVDMRDEKGSIIAHFDHHGPTFFAPRRVYKRIFRDFAISKGAQLYENALVSDIKPALPAIVLNDGRVVCADLVIGADGSRSQVRQSLFPSFAPIRRDMACYQVSLPLDVVERDPLLQKLTNGPYNSMTISPRRTIFSSPAPLDGILDMQFIDHKYTDEEDPDPSLGTQRVFDLAWFRERWRDHGPSYKRALELAQSAFKWRFVEVLGLPSWSSSNGTVVLIGDACHAMTPFAGQGTAMVIEDAAVLARLLDTSTSVDDLPLKMRKYEQARRTRVEKVQTLAQSYGRAWAATDPEERRLRNERMGEVLAKPSRQDSDAPFGHANFIWWLNHYNVLQALDDSARESAKL